MAIGAQQIDRAKTFGEKHGISTVYGSYEELSQNGDIGERYGIYPNCNIHIAFHETLLVYWQCSPGKGGLSVKNQVCMR